MILLKNEKTQLLIEKCYELIAKTSIELGLKTDGKTMAGLSTIFATDLIQERRFGNMTFNQIQDAFHQGVRFGKDEPFLNIRTFYKWTYAQKKLIVNAYYEVHTLNNPKGKTLWYQEPLKLLK